MDGELVDEQQQGKNIEVIVRVRPLIEREKGTDDVTTVSAQVRILSIV